MSTLLDAFKTITPEARPVIAGDARLLVAKYSRGNVSLQLGRFTTEEEVAERRESLRDYKFSF